MITLRRIQLTDFLSHADTEIKFDVYDRMLLDGASGSGKSSIVDAIIWGLYGVGRAENKSLVRAGTKGATVTIDLFDDTNEASPLIRVQRKITAGGKHSLEILSTQNGTDWVAVGPAGVKESQAWLENDLLHASYELFVNSVAYPQGNKESFVLASSSRRKELLLEIVNIEDISSYYEKTRALANTREQEIASITGELAANTHMYAEAEKNAAKKDEYEKEVTVLDAEVATIETQYAAMKAAQDETATKILALKDIKNKRDALVLKDGTLRNSVDAAKKELEELTAARDTTALEKRLGELLPKEQEYKEVQAEQQAAYEKQQERQALISSQPMDRGVDSIIESLQVRLAKMEASHPACPSGDDCPYMKQYTPELKSLQDEIAEKKREKETFIKSVEVWANELEKYPAVDMTVYATKIADLLPYITELNEIRKEFDRRLNVDALIDAKNQLIAEREAALVEVVAELSAVSGQLTGYDEERLRNDLQTFSSSLAPLFTQLSEKRSLLVNTKALLKSAVDATQTMARITARNAEIETQTAKGRDEVRILNLLKAALGSNGIRAMAIDYILPLLEEKINNILSQLSDFKIRLDTQRAGSGKDTTVEGLFITIRNAEGEEFSFENYSGGERLRITVAITEALASLQRVGFRIFDEMYTALDEENLLSFVDVFTKLQGSYDQMICISHLTPIKDLFEKKLTLVRINGISTIV